jgi:hypothetical protein
MDWVESTALSHVPSPPPIISNQRVLTLTISSSTCSNFFLHLYYSFSATICILELSFSFNCNNNFFQIIFVKIETQERMGLEKGTILFAELRTVGKM